MKTVTLFAVLMLGTLLTGCGTMDVDVTSAGRESLLGNVPPNPNVRLSAQLLSHNDQLVYVGITHQIASEKIFRQVFTGHESAPASLDLVSAKFSRTETGKLEVTYEIVVTLRRPAQGDQQLRAVATSSRVAVDTAMREAAERAVLELANQVRALGV